MPEVVDRMGQSPSLWTVCLVTGIRCFGTIVRSPGGMHARPGQLMDKVILRPLGSMFKVGRPVLRPCGDVLGHRLCWAWQVILIPWPPVIMLGWQQQRCWWERRACPQGMCTRLGAMLLTLTGSALPSVAARPGRQFSGSRECMLWLLCPSSRLHGVLHCSFPGV